MSIWVVSLHSTGGSMMEAVDSMAAWSFDKEADANQWAEKLNDQFNRNQDWLCAQVIEVKPHKNFKWPTIPSTDPRMAAVVKHLGRPLAPNEIAIDTEAVAKGIVEAYENGVEWPEEAPPPKPVTDEELEATRRSILGHDT